MLLLSFVITDIINIFSQLTQMMKHILLINCHKYSNRMMINHSTLDYHVTYFNTFSRYGSDGQIKTLTLYSDPYPNTNHSPNPNVKFDLLSYMAMSRDIT